jgi:two-component system alkaline phosphatase synthesis response regulator PhoP
MKRLIYLVEDDASIRELVVYMLRSTGFEAQGFCAAGEFWEAARKAVPSLVILDIMLPGEDGLAILRKLRSSESTRRVPVIMLTAKGAEYDKVLGLDSGADDYMAKPAGMMELAARVKSLLRRSDPESDGEKEEYRLNGLYVNLPRRQVLAEGREITLTLKEFDLLAYLLKHSGMALSRERILRAVWDYSLAMETRTVDTHILTLRTKLGPCGALIQTVRGVGYKTGAAE